MTAFRYASVRGESVSITGLSGNPDRLFVPSACEGRKVTEIAERAFANHPEITEIEIPDGICSIGNYAFYNCVNLKKLTLTDSVRDYGDGVIRMCPSLREIRIVMRNGYFRLVKDILSDTDAQLQITLQMEDGTARLVFPAFHHEYREDPWARVIHASIIGTGYSYRTCVTRRGIDYESYDGCFIRGEMAGESAADGIALARLMYPYSLAEKAKKRYLEYLDMHAERILTELIRRGDADGVRYLAGSSSLRGSIPEEAVRLASDLRETEICGILMEASRGRFADFQGMETFSLDDL